MFTNLVTIVIMCVLFSDGHPWHAPFQARDFAFQEVPKSGENPESTRNTNPLVFRRKAIIVPCCSFLRKITTSHQESGRWYIFRGSQQDGFKWNLLLQKQDELKVTATEAKINIHVPSKLQIVDEKKLVNSGCREGYIRDSNNNCVKEFKL